MAESDVTPILSKDDEEDEMEDIPDSDRFREVPPPYSEIESADDQTVKQVNARKNCLTPTLSSLVHECFINQDDGSTEGAGDRPELRVYTRRWYILALFCAMACHQVRQIYYQLSTILMTRNHALFHQEVIVILRRFDLS